MSQSATVVHFPTGTPQQSVAPASGDAKPEMTPDVITEKYLKLRDKVAEIKEDHKKQLAPYVIVMEKLENMLLDTLNRAGVDSMRAPTGTFYKVTHKSCKVTEWSKTLEFIREHDFWELLEARVSKTAVEEILKSTDEPIPGVTMTSYVEVNVRRPASKG